MYIYKNTTELPDTEQISEKYIKPDLFKYSIQININ